MDDPGRLPRTESELKMTEPPRTIRKAAGGLGLVLALAVAPGCSSVPQSRLDDCRKLAQTVQADNDRLKDSALRLRAEHRDLAERSAADSDRVRALAEDNVRLERSVQEYQGDRERLVAEFNRVTQQARAVALAGGAAPTALLDRFREFEHAHPGSHFDPGTGVASIPVDLLFDPDSAEPNPGAAPLLADLAGALAIPEARAMRVAITAPGPAVRLAGHAPDPRPARVARASDLLTSSGLDPARLAPDDSSPRIEIRLLDAPDRPAP
jgi:hypothetical protein